jgi:hypothetical protein
VPGARIDIGAFESQPIPSAFYGDYNQNIVVDAAGGGACALAFIEPVFEFGEAIMVVPEEANPTPTQTNQTNDSTTRTFSTRPTVFESLRR